MKDGFIKVMAASPEGMRVADCENNAAQCAEAALTADAEGVSLIVFPELCLTGYTCGDLFLNKKLIDAALEALRDYLTATAECEIISVVGLPLLHVGKLYNCAAVCQGGMLLGLVPKSHIPNYAGMDESRYFAPAPDANLTYEFDGCFVQFGTKQLFVSTTTPDFRFAVEIGADAEAMIPPSTYEAMAGATVICHPSASPEIVGREDFRKQLAASLSARLTAGYLSAEAGCGESTTDFVFSGHTLIAENGEILSEKAPFAGDCGCVTELDLEHLTHERRRISQFLNQESGEYTEVYFTQTLTETELTRSVDPHPFIPSVEESPRRCERILDIQATGLARRLTAAHASKAVIGISGGLDSCLALLVTVRAMDLLGRPHSDILAVTMPCFGTTVRTKSNATVLCEELGVDFSCVDIMASVRSHFADIGHDPDNHNVVYENAQARERTQILMDIANGINGLVVGTGDLSELALGWATYNGDHMSMYSVNGGVSKTLVRHLVSHCAHMAAVAGQERLSGALLDILGTPVSPELLPAKENGEIAQVTEDLVGPYELHDFYLYHLLRYGSTPTKLFRLAKHALGDVYDDPTLLKWLEIFLRRFFNQQFKRSCLPDGPKVGSVGLSPRGDWRMPSDASSALWLAEVKALRAEY